METAKVKKMKRHYLPFEKPLKDLDFEIEKLTTSESDSKQLKDLIAERENLEKEIFADLSPWETVQLARHPNRPYTLDYINACLLYTSPSPRDGLLSRMPSSA